MDKKELEDGEVKGIAEIVAAQVKALEGAKLSPLLEHTLSGLRGCHETLCGELKNRETAAKQPAKE